MNTRPILLPVLLSLTACAAPTLPSNPSPAVTSAASNAAPLVVPDTPPAPPPPRAPVQRPDPNFNAVAFETEGSPPGIRGQYEAAARAYREAAAQSPSPQREQYLDAARKLDRQAAELVTR